MSASWECYKHGLVEPITVSGEGVNGRHIQQEQCPECRAVCDPVFE